ncbi:hypothetical protein FNU76_04325 [Chitinimonas arctica]|uniref:Phage abortive infection protein n=1 Tax=Chitinimonas arctica TaxID=2594795 RepID=A0A516SBX0_9NEIS|nr:hypothetical protein [Chitinimonas arctica]QDQ25641.1 hypothetical protein FNU76_04325 [Chitinimonas arctica]
MQNKYAIVAAAILFTIVTAAYAINFIGYPISEKPEAWGQLGDYIGGLLNPVLSFISIILLIKSLSLQIEANKGLEAELNNNEKREKIRAFESLFFSMIDSQKELFKSFSILPDPNNTQSIASGSEAVIKIEDRIEEIQKNEAHQDELMNYLDFIDQKDQIFNNTRSFYIIVKLISERLSNENGFSIKDREIYLKALINFTDFSQIRLIIISGFFESFYSVRYLKSNDELKNAMSEVGLSFDLYQSKPTPFSDEVGMEFTE